MCRFSSKRCGLRQRLHVTLGYLTMQLEEWPVDDNSGQILSKSSMLAVSRPVSGPHEHLALLLAILPGGRKPTV